MQVNLFTAGDSADIDTWSNLPYFLSRALMRKGVRVERFDLVPRHKLYWLRMFLRRYYHRVLRRFFRQNRPYDFFRDEIAYQLTRRKLKEFSQRGPAADFNLFLTFSFSTGQFTATPIMHLADITYEQYLEESGKKKRRRDLRFIQRESENLHRAHAIFATSERCRNFLRTRYGLTNVRKLTSGINLEVEEIDDVTELLSRKWKAKSILFVGRGVHKRGIDILTRAFAIFNERNGHDFTLSLVGVSQRELGAAAVERTDYYPYLSKGRPEELSLYLDLLRSATVFVMPMREGPFPGVIREALLLYTPVIMSNVWNEELNVKDNYNGILVDRIEPETFAEEMHSLLQTREKWERLARNAYESVQKFSWDRTAQEVIEAMMAPAQ